MGNTSPKDMDSLLPLMNMVIYSIDKVKKLRLNREASAEPTPSCTPVSAFQSRALLKSSLDFQGKVKADRNRARVEENFLKQTHTQRQEAAQTRREEKKRAEKERIMSEEDPDRQRRLEVWKLNQEVLVLFQMKRHRNLLVSRMLFFFRLN